MATNSATHFQHLLEGRNKEVAGSTYREIKDLVLSIIQNGYFDWKPQMEVEPEVKEVEVVEPVMEVPINLEVRPLYLFLFQNMKPNSFPICRFITAFKNPMWRLL